MMNFFKVTIVIQLTSALVGIPINCLVLLVRGLKFWKKKKISSYQFIIVNLAAADLFASIILCIQAEYAINEFSWSHSRGTCTFVKYVSEICNSIPGLFILLLSFERYYGTASMTKKWRLPTTVIVSIVIWVFTLGARTPTALVATTYQYRNETVCSILEYANYGAYYLNFRMITFFAVPLITTVFFNFKLYFFIRSHHHHMAFIRSFNGKSGGTSSNANNVSRRNSLDPATISRRNSRRPTLNAISENEEKVTFFISEERNDKEGSTRIKLKRLINCLSCVCKKQENETIPLSREQRISKNVRLKINILLAITVFFFLCFLPHHTYHFLFYYNRQAYINIWRKVNWLSWFRYFHCFINGFIYSVMDATFRKDVWMIVKSIVTCKSRFKEENLVLASASVRTTRSMSVS